MPNYSEQGRKVWIKDAAEAWVPGVIVHEGDTSLKTRTVKYVREDAAAEETATVEESGDGVTLKTRNLFDDDDAAVRGYEHVHDLTRLTHLHEPEILQALSVRFARNQIYTNTGPILLAVNPFKPLPLYSSDQLAAFYGSGLLKSQGLDAPPLPPHVYASAVFPLLCVLRVKS